MAPPVELAESRQWTRRFLRQLGVEGTLPAAAELPAAYSALVRGVLSSAPVSASASPRVSCTLTVSPASVNAYNTLHGGMVAAVAEAVGMACARAAAGNKEMFLGELSAAYLSAARLNSEVEVEAHIYSGRADLWWLLRLSLGSRTLRSSATRVEPPSTSCPWQPSEYQSHGW